MYKDIKTLLEESKRLSLPLHRVILENEMRLLELSEEEVYARLDAHYEVMFHSAMKSLHAPQDESSLIAGQSKRQHAYSRSKTLAGAYINDIMAMAFSCSEVNAGMGRVCAAPTAGACGILPAVLIATSERLQSSKKEILDALLVASGFGAILAANATLSGAAGGCQAECGAAAAMAASAVVYLAKGEAEMCAHAAAIALMNCMGLICDPVAGLVQLPCSFRNASQAVNAIISADMALAGQKSVIPADEVIGSMYRVGRQLPPELKETSRGGIAMSPTGRAIAEQMKKI